MKHHFIKYFMVATAIALTLSSCQDDEINHLNANDVNKQSLSDSDTSFKNVFSFRFKQPTNSLTKGLLVEQSDYLETGEAFFKEDLNKTYKTMKVYRKSDPLKYFYIMLTNLDIPYPFDIYLNDSKQVITSECGPYANDNSYLKEYGLLYSKYGAEHIKDYICMKLPLVRNGKEVPNRTKIVRGRLMKPQDIADLFEKTDLLCDSVDDLSIKNTENGYENGYYNAFVFGIDLKYKDSDANHSLGGFRDIYNVNYSDEIAHIRKEWPGFPDYALKQIYTRDCAHITHTGYYWMSNDVKGDRRILQIHRNEWMSESYPWIATYIYARIPDKPNIDYGYSVRLVFDPFDN